MSTDDWPFDKSKCSAAFTSESVIKGISSIVFVCCDRDNDFQFMCEQEEGPKVVCLEEVYNLDPSVGELANLPPGWCATRNSPEDEWVWKEMENEEALPSDLVETAMQLLNEKNHALSEEYSFGEWERWDFDQEVAELVLSHKGKVKVRCKVQCIGTYSFISNTWMWAWHNKSILDHLKTDSLKTREYGEAHKHEKLTASGGFSKEEDAWEFSSITLYIAGGEGVYSTPHSDSTGRSFLLIKEVEIV